MASFRNRHTVNRVVVKGIVTLIFSNVIHGKICQNREPVNVY